MKKFISTTLVFAMFTTMAFCQTERRDSTFRRHTLGTSLFLLGNIGDSVSFFQLNYGYRLSQKDNLIVEAITWTYYEPLGTFGSSEEFFPGKVRAYGIGLGYQRFLWKNLFTTVEPTFFIQQFYDNNDTKNPERISIVSQFILGYRIELFKKRMFVEPAYALKYWPVTTNVPSSFAEIENGIQKYKFEPSLNFGFRF
ncbi:MAG: hypothetical protein IPN67_04905 [Bacteroidales bacterium]|nr:hypothetical protein [Bacteroidales bacterium]